MTLQGLLVHDVTIVTPATATDRYGNAGKNWTSATRTTVKGWVSRRDDPGGDAEVGGDREAFVSGWVLFVEADTTLTGFDRVEWEGHTFEVNGMPNPAWSPRGLHHKEAGLRLVDG